MLCACEALRSNFAEKTPPIEWMKAKKLRRERGIALSVEKNRVGSCREFCTIVHRFAQVFEQNLIDAVNRKIYFAFQIEPGSLRTLRINLEGAARLNIGCAARLNRKARSLSGFVWRA